MVGELYEFVCTWVGLDNDVVAVCHVMQPGNPHSGCPIAEAQTVAVLYQVANSLVKMLFKWLAHCRSVFVRVPVPGWVE